MSIINKNIIVTGATGGIGREVVKSLAAAKANVAFCSRNEENVNAFFLELKEEFPEAVFYCCSCDISSESDVKKFIGNVYSEFGKIDGVVNNAGVGYFDSFLDLTEEKWNEIINTNVHGTVKMCREVIPYILKNDKENGKRGIIINVGSSSPQKYVAGNIAYASSKAALKTFSEYLFNEYRKSGISVTHVSVGSVNTGFSKRNKDTIGWKIKPWETGYIIKTLAEMAFVTENACLPNIDVRTMNPIECNGDKE